METDQSSRIRIAGELLDEIPHAGTMLDRQVACWRESLANQVDDRLAIPRPAWIAVEAASDVLDRLREDLSRQRQHRRPREWTLLLERRLEAAKHRTYVRRIERDEVGRASREARGLSGHGL